VKPTARSMARAGACLAPSTTRLEKVLVFAPPSRALLFAFPGLE